MISYAYQFKTHCKGDSHSSKNANIILPGFDCDKTSCRREAATIRPCPSPPSVGAKAPRAAKPTAAPTDGNVAVGSHGDVPTVTAAAA